MQQIDEIDILGYHDYICVPRGAKDFPVTSVPKTQIAHGAALN